MVLRFRLIGYGSVCASLAALLLGALPATASLPPRPDAGQVIAQAPEDAPTPGLGVVPPGTGMPDDTTATQEIDAREAGRPAPIWTSSGFWWIGVAALLALAMLVWHYLHVLRVNRILVAAGRARESRMLALRASETRYRDLIENSNLAVMIAAPDGRRLYVNRAYAALLGYETPEQLMALPSAPVGHVIVAPHDRDRVTAYREAVFAGRWVPPSYEFDALRRDGSIVPVQAFTQRISWNGEPALQRVFIDLTERRRAEAALRESEARFRHIFESGGTGTILRTLDGIIIEANKAFADFVGYTPRELIGKSIREFSLPEDLEALQERMSRHARGEADGLTLERQYRHRDGSTRWAIVNTAIARGANGEPLYVVTTVRDINERKLAERALAESEVRHREMMEQFPLGIQIFDLLGRRLFLNRAFVDLVGYRSTEEVLMAPRGTFIAREEQPVLRALHAQLIDGSIEAADNEMTIVRRDGRHVPVHGFARRIVWMGRPAIQRTYVDLSERKRAEAAMRASEERFRTVFEAGGAGMTICDMNARYTQVNKSFGDLLGYRPDELIGRSVLEVTHPKDRAAVIEAMQSLQAERTASLIGERRYLCKDGGTVWCIVCVVIARNEVTGERYQIGIIQDITERKKTEEALAVSRERLVDAQRIARLGNWERDLATGRLHWSDEMFRIFGLEPEAFSGDFDGFLNLVVHPEDRALIADMVRECLRTGKPFGVDYRILRPDGEHVLHAEGEITVGEHGEPKRIAGTVQDVTELRRARAALEASEARFRGVFEAGGAAIVLTDRDGTIHEYNRAFAAFLGYGEDELVGGRIQALFRPEDAGAAEVQRRDLFEGRIERFELERGFIRKDGETVWASVSATLMRNAPNRPNVLIGIIQDITQRKRSERALAQKTALLDLMQALTTAANHASNFAEAVQDCLDRVCAFTGWPVGHAFVRSKIDPDVLRPMLVWHLADPDRFAPYRSATEGMVLRIGVGMPGLVVSSGDVEWRTRIPLDPSRPTIRANAAEAVGLKSGFAAPVMTGNRVVAVLEFYATEVVARDEGIVEVIRQAGTELGRVFEREQAEKVLRRREEQLRQIIDNVPHWIYVKDRDGRYLLANKALASAYDMTIEDVIGRTQHELYPDQAHAARILAHDRSVIVSGQISVVPEGAFHTAGGHRKVRITKMPYTTQLGEVAVLGIAEDVTEQLQAEEELRRAQRMDALGKMTGGIAHDFNNLLTIILGNLQLLERRLDDAPLRDLAETAERAAQRGADVTRRLLAFARSQPLDPCVVDLNDLVRDMTVLVERSLGTGIEIETTLAPDLWQTRADPSQVENALLNLVLNARDAMPGGGRLTIETANVTARERSRGLGNLPPGQYAMLAVTDTGCGMTPDVIARAFEPFFTTKEVGKGSGLGLSMIYGFVRQSGGDVVIRSRPGKGTTVRLYLPRSTADSRPEEGAKPTASADARETVLVVEDDQDVRAFARTALEALDYRIIEAGDAASALSVIDQNLRIDVLFTDLKLPGGKDGAALVGEARSRMPSLYAIVTSGNPEHADALSDAGTAFLRKPYTQKELAGMIRMILDRRYRREA